MSDLVRHYRNYYREQTTDSFDDLFRCMVEYDFSSYYDDMRRVSAMHSQSRCMGEFSALWSGGSSTGIRRKHNFGPNFHHVRESVEGFLRCKETCLVSFSSFRGLKRLRIERTEAHREAYQMLGCWFDDGFVSDAIRFLDFLSGRVGLINLFAKPHIWLQLTTNPMFRSWLPTSSVKTLINTDNIQCFCRVEHKTRDQMIDWCGGVNFYTCEFGRRHFLPSFYLDDSGSLVNLLNLNKSPRSSDDLVSIKGERNFCNCGFPFLHMEFVPHFRNFPRTAAGGLLDPAQFLNFAEDRTSILQIYQESESGPFTVFHNCSGSSECPRLCASVLDSFGFGKTRVSTSRYLVVGTKRPFLWTGGKPLFVEIN